MAANTPGIVSEIVTWDALELSRAIRERQVSCVEVMTAFLDQIARHNPTYNAIVSLRDRDELLAEAGVPKVRFHDLRHGAATYLVAAGVPMRVVMAQLGHSQMAITSDLYSHVLPEVQREASERTAVAPFGVGSTATS